MILKKYQSIAILDTRKTKKVIREIDLLVIDEVSMVRCDLLDVIDKLLRVFGKSKSLPFGGVQLLFIGDPFQLAPIVKNDDELILSNYYESYFFFGAKSYQRLNPIFIELKKVYRQTDQKFINLLNRVRENKISERVLESLNNRYIPNYNFYDDLSKGKIYLGTHNDDVNYVNQSKLDKLEGVQWEFIATITGDFKPSDCQADNVLKLKIGAQVMILKNDIENDLYNGKICLMTKVDKETETLQVEDKMGKSHVLERYKWTKYKYYVNENGSVEKEEIGSMSQFPVKLAWAISVHKSQGLTFENVIANLQSSFAFGQVYVGLSRCTSYEGLILTNTIPAHAIRTDPKVTDFYKSSSSNDEVIELLNQSEASTLYKKGRDLYIAGHFNDAIEIFHEAYRKANLIFSENGKRWMRVILNRQNHENIFREKLIKKMNNEIENMEKMQVERFNNFIQLEDKLMDKIDALEKQNEKLSLQNLELSKRKWYHLLFRI